MGKNQNKYDVIIIGAGPAGLNLARELGKEKLSILILDNKSCASDIRYTTCASFMDFEDFNLPMEIGHKINQNCFVFNNAIVRNKGKAHVIDKRKLLLYLEKEALKNSNCKIKYSASIDDIEFDSAGGVGKIFYSPINGENKSIVSAKVYADCSGETAVISKKIGILNKKYSVALGIEYLVPLKLEPNTTDLFVGKQFDGGYGWIFPKNDNMAIVGCGTMNNKYFQGIKDRLDNMWKIKRVAERCEKKPIETNIGILHSGFPLSKYAKENVVSIGDSALQANPLVGEGTRFVMGAAKIAAKWIKKAVKQNDITLLQNYSKEWRNKYYKKYKVAFRFREIVNEIARDDKKCNSFTNIIAKLPDEDVERSLKGDVSYFNMIKFLYKVIFN